MRIAVFDDAGVISNVVVADDESILPQLGIRNYRVLGERESADIPCHEESVDEAGLSERGAA